MAELPEQYTTISQEAHVEFEEKRSTFIGAVKRVSSVAEAEAFVKTRKKMHPDARHTVFAYLLRDGNKRYGDDSEPQGTAGMPTLKAIEQRGLADVCVATTRYFGGILLGVVEAICNRITVIAPYTDAIEFSILIIILLVKPSGILGKKRREKV